MDAQQMWMLVDRAIGLLHSVDENAPESAIRLVDAAADDLINVRATLALAAIQAEQEAVK